MNKKVFSTIAAMTVGTIAASGLLMKTSPAFAGEEHEHAADAKVGEKGAESGHDKEHKAEGSESSGEQKAESKSEMSCSAHACSANSCSGKK